MTKKTNKNQLRNPQRAFTVKKVAEMHGVSHSYVYKILRGEKRNDEIFLTYMDMHEGTNALIEEVKKLIG